MTSTLARPAHRTTTTTVVMIAAAVLLDVAFTGLGVVFNYPDVLKQPAADVLTAFRADQVAVSGWFLALALGAALLAPVAVGVGRLSAVPAMRWAVRAGVAAAAVQVVGLLRVAPAGAGLGNHRRRGRPRRGRRRPRVLRDGQPRARQPGR
jgi:hypothetical protein